MWWFLLVHTHTSSCWNKNFSLNISFLEISEEFRRDSKNEFKLALVNEPSEFELLKFDYTLICFVCLCDFSGADSEDKDEVLL